MDKQPIVCWTEIPVSDLEKASAFYAEVFGWEMKITPAGPNDIAVFDGADEAAGGHLYPGKPAQGNGPTVHLTTKDGIAPTAARLEKAGGQVLGPVIEIPSGRFQYATDLDGNSIGLFELGTA